METVLAILAAAFGSGWAIQIAFYRYEKRKRKAEVENVELDLDNMMNCKKNGWVKLINISADCKELLTPSVING